MQLRLCESYPTAYHGSKITPEIFVWHSTDGGGKWWLDQLFSGRTTNSGAKITVHFGIYKDGDLVQYAPWKRGEAVACWHAGKSMWQGKESCNFFSLGCEIQHSPGKDFTPEQLDAIWYLTRIVQAEYPTMQHTTHKYISGALQGKTDPFSPQWESQAWPIIQRVINNQEDDLTDEDRKLLQEIKQSTIATSYRENIMLALLNNNLNKATELFDEALAAGINVEGYSRPQ